MQSAREGGFGLYGPGARSLFHPCGFGPEEVVPWVGLTCLVEQCAGFDALPVCFFESAGEDPEGGFFGAGFDSGCVRGAGGGVVGLLLMDLALDHVEFCEFGEFGDGGGEGGEGGRELVLLAFEYGGFHPDLKEN